MRRSALAADEQDRELLTADAREQVAGSQLGLPGHGRALEQRVAGGMPERVVEGLEPVEVERHDGERLPGPMGSGDGGLQLGVPAAAVRDAGERIGGAEGIELSGLRADLTDESRHAPQHEQEEHSGCGADHHQVRFSPPGPALITSTGATREATARSTNRDLGEQRGRRMVLVWHDDPG